MKIKESWRKLNPFIKGGIVGLIFAIILIIFDNNALGDGDFNLSIIFHKFYLTFYLINLLKHFFVFGIFWHFFKKMKKNYNKKTWKIILFIGGIIGIIGMFIIQVSPLFIEEKSIFELETFSEDIIISIFYPPPYFGVVWGTIFLFPNNLIFNALIGISLFLIIIYIKNKKNDTPRTKVRGIS